MSILSTSNDGKPSYSTSTEHTPFAGRREFPRKFVDFNAEYKKNRMIEVDIIHIGV